MHHGPGKTSTLEGPPELVSRRGTGPHDRRRYAALYGGADACPGAIASGGSPADDYRARSRGGHRARSYYRSDRPLTVFVSYASGATLPQCGWALMPRY